MIYIESLIAFHSHSQPVGLNSEGCLNNVNLRFEKNDGMIKIICT